MATSTFGPDVDDHDWDDLDTAYEAVCAGVVDDPQVVEETVKRMRATGRLSEGTAEDADAYGGVIFVPYDYDGFGL